MAIRKTEIGGLSSDGKSNRGTMMVNVTRRQFGALSAAALTFAASSMPRVSLAAGPARIVVIGGGPGGATVANHLKAADPSLDVVLVEPKQTYTTCFSSNLYLGGFRSFNSITFDYEGIRKRGITVVADVARAIDPDARTVLLGRSDTVLPYDRLVVAPGIDIKYETIDGYSSEVAKEMPHAWQAGQQTWLLKQQLLALSDGGVVVMSAPPNPYRCPPGPYERACMIAHFLKTRKPRSKLILFDAKSTISKQDVFEEAFNAYYREIVELNLTNEIDDYTVVRVDPATREVVTKSGRSERASVVNIIPAQKAGAIAAQAGLTEGDWCPVHPENFISTLIKDVYVLGDAAVAADMPKSAFSAMSQAGVVAADILADLSGKPRTAGKYRNTCWSMVAPESSAKVGGDYVPGSKNGAPALIAHDAFVSKAGETDAVRRATHDEGRAWYDSAVDALFGAPATDRPE